jgi:hypothetical protein
MGRSDTWSLMLSMLTVLTCVYPFWWVSHDKDRKVRSFYRTQFFLACLEIPTLMRQSLDKYYSKLLSPEALSFFQHALVVDWRDRPTPEQLLEHSYMLE